MSAQRPSARTSRGYAAFPVWPCLLTCRHYGQCSPIAHYACFAQRQAGGASDHHQGSATPLAACLCLAGSPAMNGVYELDAAHRNAERGNARTGILAAQVAITVAGVALSGPTVAPPCWWQQSRTRPLRWAMRPTRVPRRPIPGKQQSLADLHVQTSASGRLSPRSWANLATSRQHYLGHRQGRACPSGDPKRKGGPSIRPLPRPIRSQWPSPSAIAPHRAGRRSLHILQRLHAHLR